MVENLTGMENFEYSLSAGREGGITIPTICARSTRSSNGTRPAGSGACQAFSDIMKRLNKNMHGDDPAFYRLPENSELAAQYLLLMSFRSLRQRPQQRINIDKSARA